MRVQSVGTCVRTFTYARVCECICVRADERSCVRRPYASARVYVCVRARVGACGCACARNVAHVSVYACALAGAGWRACGYACVCVYK